MRGDTDLKRLEEFMRSFGRAARSEGRVYFTGGTTALLFGWRQRTVDIDIRLDPERDVLFRAIAVMKDELDVNIEIASPPDFIPSLPGWQDRSIFIRREGKLDFYHFDLYSQALAKVERGHVQDIKDVDSMFSQKLIEPERLSSLFAEIEPKLYLYPAIRPDRFRESLTSVLAKQKR